MSTTAISQRKESSAHDTIATNRDGLRVAKQHAKETAKTQPLPVVPVKHSNPALAALVKLAFEAQHFAETGTGRQFLDAAIEKAKAVIHQSINRINR